MLTEERRKELMARPYITLQEAVELIGGVRTENTIKNWIASRKLKGTQPAGKGTAWYVKPQDLIDFMDRGAPPDERESA